MNRLGSAIILTSQGVPFFQAGEEMLRSKPSATVEGGFDENSYTSPDATNSIKWAEKTKAEDTYAYYKGLIAFRKAHSALRMTTAADIQSNLVFMYTIENNANDDTAEKIVVVFNGSRNAVDVTLPTGIWEICVNDKTAGTASLGTVQGTISVPGISAIVLVQGDDTIVKAGTKTEQEADKSASTENTDTAKTAENVEKASANTPLIIGGIVVAVIAVAAGVFVKKRKK